ncbi:Ig-like domain-containing protein [Bordetella trematum]|uniref:Ig-like domain-containing protein n=1 Tax=Bordetella trematum TaxID=123899 RepID=UPI0015C54743|nr:Ig-like domain-containing protein [Bordetella trematum]
MDRVIWPQARNAWFAVGEHAISRGRARRILSSALCLTVGAQAGLPLTAWGQGAPVLARQRVDETPGGAPVLRQVAGQIQELARREADNGPGLNGDYLRRQGQAHFNQFLQGGVQAARESDLPFLRHLQGDLRYDFDLGRTSLELRTIDEIYRHGPHSVLLQLGAHNQNERPTANVGAIYRREVLEGLLLGANAFVDYEFGKQHGRGSLGWEALAPQFSLHANIYFPLSAWKGAKRDGRREERPASGMDVGLKFRPAFLPGLELKASHFRWNGAGIDYFDNGRPQNRATGFKYGVQYKPVPLLSLGLEQDKVMGGARQTRVQLGVTINLSEPLSKQWRRDTPAPGFSPSRTALVERENRIVLNTRRKQIILPLSIAQVTTHQIDGRLTVIGQTQPRATVTIRMPDGAPGSVTADVSGRYAYTSRGDQPSGNIVLRASNAEGDTSREVTYHYLDEVPLGDLQVEVVALLPQPADRALEVQGVTEPMADVRVSFPNGESVGVTADGKGHFRARSKRQVAQGQVTVQAVDPRTLKEARAALPYLPPQVITPTTNEIVTHPDTGRVTLTGTAEPGTEVRVSFPDGTDQAVRVGATGGFTVTSEGDVPSGMITVQATDTAGNSSPEARHEYVDTVDKTAPEAPADTKVSTDPTSGRVTVTGSAEPAAHVTVTFPDGSNKRAQADAHGRYTVTSDADVPSGTISTRVTDAAGNSGPEARLEYVDTVDKTAPEAPADTKVSTDTTSGRVTVTGSTEPAAHVTVTFPDGSSKRVQAGADGRYTVTSDADMSSGAINTQVTDTSGNTSPEVRHEYIDTVDKTPPAAPVAAGVTTDSASGRVTVSGTAEPGAEVRVSFPDGTSQTVNADAEGGYTATSARDVPSGPIKVQASDAAGNKSAEVRYEYTDTVDKTPPAAPVAAEVTTDAVSGQVTVSGTAEPGAEVRVSFPDGTSQTVNADAAGGYTVTSARDVPAGMIKMQATDASGNKSPEVRHEYVDTVDKTAPAAPADMKVSTDTTSGRVTVTGSTEPAAHVTVTFPDGSNKRVQADAHGRYTVTSDADVPSGTISTRATDAAGNTGPELRHEYTDTVDKTPPAAPVAAGVTTDPASGRVTVSGTAEPGASVTVVLPDGTRKTVTAGTTGSYTVVSDGDMSSGPIRIWATDAAGNNSPEVMRTYTDMVDKTPPPAPKVADVATDEASGQVTVTGTAEPGAQVTVRFPDGTGKTVVAGADGAYRVTSEGDMVAGDITVSATDASGNKGPKTSKTYVDSVDKTPPPLAISAVTENLDTGQVTVRGDSEPGSRVTVTFSDGSRKTVVAGDDGAYTATSAGDLPSGSILARAVDEAGNSSAEARHAYVDTVDKTPPEEPSITSITTNATSGQVTVTGKAEPGADVTVTFPDTTSKKVKADTEGTYTATSDKDVPTGMVKVLATDAAGNEGEEIDQPYRDERKALSTGNIISLLAEPGKFRPIEISRERATLTAYFDVIGVAKPLVRIEPVDPADANARKLIDLLQVRLQGWRRGAKAGTMYLEKPAGTGPDGTVAPGDYAVKVIFTDPGIPEAQVVIPGVIRWS